MDVSTYLTLTPEQKRLRKTKYRQRQDALTAPVRAHALTRALKALTLLRRHRDSPCLDPGSVDACAALVFEASRASFFFFCRHVLDMDLLTEATHQRWCDDAQAAIAAGKKRLMRLKPRASYKTSVYGIGMVLWLWAVYGPGLRIFYTSSNALLLDEVSDKLNQYIGNEKTDTLYSTIFGVVRDGSAKNTGDVFNIMGRSGKGFSLILRTAGGNTVGIHPNIIVIDDPLDKNDRESEATRQQKQRWFDSLTPLLVPARIRDVEFESIFYVGTRWHMKDLVRYILDLNEKFDDDEKWDVEIESIMKPDGSPSYPEFFTKEKIDYLRKSMDEIFFACQYQNNPLPEGLQIFDLNRLTFVRPDQFFPDANTLPRGEVLCVFDPSLGKTHSDFPAVWWLHFHDNVMTFFDAIDQKIELTRLVHVIAAKNLGYGCRRLLFENNGVSLVENYLKDAHDRMNWRIHLDSIKHTSNKDERITSMQPDLYSGSVRFMSDYEQRYPEAMAQLIFYPVYGHDDFPDCAQMGVEYFRRKHFKFIRYEAMH